MQTLKTNFKKTIAERNIFRGRRMGLLFGIAEEKQEIIKIKRIQIEKKSNQNVNKIIVVSFKKLRKL